MDVDRIAAWQIIAELADRLEKRQAFDIADGAANLDQHEVDIAVARLHEVLDGVGDVRDDLHGAAEIVASPLLGQDVLVDAAGRDVVGFLGGNAGEALVVAEIQVGRGAVVGDE